MICEEEEEKRRRRVRAVSFPPHFFLLTLSFLFLRIFLLLEGSLFVFFLFSDVLSFRRLVFTSFFHDGVHFYLFRSKHEL